MSKLTFNPDLSSKGFAPLDNFSQVLGYGIKEKSMIFSGIVIIFSLVFYFFIMTPSQDEIAILDEGVAKQEKQYNRYQVLAKNIKKSRIEYVELKAQFKEAKNMLPKKSQIPDLLDDVNKAAASTGLRFSVFQPSPEKPHGGIYAEVPVRFSVNATFQQWMDFLDKVGEMQRIVDVRNVEMQTTPNGDILKVSGDIVTYRFMESEDIS